MNRRNITLTSVALGALVAGATIAALPAAAQMDTRTSVFDTLSNDPRFGTTMKMVYVSGAANRLSSAGELTVFAATDDGWDRSPFEGMLSSLSSTGAASEFPQTSSITQVLRGFFVRGEPTAPTGQDVTMRSVAGRPIEFDGRAMTVKWIDPKGESHSAAVTGKPILATNGVIYPVDAVVGQ